MVFHDFLLYGVLHIQSNPFILGHTNDLMKWPGEKMDYKQAKVLSEIKTKYKIIRVLQFPNYTSNVITLGYLGRCYIYRTLYALALLFNEPMDDSPKSGFIPCDSLTLSTDNPIKVDEIEEWILMDDLIEEEDLSKNLAEGIHMIIGVEGFDLFCYSFKFNKIGYTEFDNLKGILLW